MKKSLIFTAFIMFFSILGASENEILLESSAKEITIGESFIITLKATGISSTKEIEINGINEFDILGSSSGMSTKIINGKFSSETVLSLNISAKKSGKYEISGKIRGKEKVSNKVVIDVKGESGIKKEILEESNESAMFIKNSKLPAKAYFGEKIPLTVDFYSRNQISQAGFLEQPVYNGFIIKELEKEQSYYQILNGERYGKYILQKSVLQPVKTGKVKIKPYTFRVNYVNDYGNYDTKDFKTNESELDIIALPEPKPENFKNIVGKVSVEKLQSKNSINFGESITVNIKLSGECNLDFIEKIYPDSIEGVKIYQTVKSKKEEIQNGKYYAEKDIEAVFIPEKSGKIAVPELNVFYFDIEKNKYESVKISSFEIKVSGNIKGEKKQSEIKKEIKNNEKNIENKIYLIEKNEKNGEKIKTLFKMAGFLFLISLILLIILYIISKCKLYIEKNRSIEKKIEEKYKINFKIDSKEEIIKKIGKNLLSEKIVEIIEEQEKEKMGFEYSKDKIKNNLKEVKEIMKKTGN